MRNLLVLLFVYCLGISCKVPFVEINGNYYRSLSETSRLRIMPYNSALLSDSNCNKYLVEIGLNDFTALINSKNNMLFVLYLPSCASLDISLFDKVWKKYHEFYTICFISLTYDLTTLRYIRKITDFPGPTYILMDSDFGHKRKKANKKCNQLFSKYDSLGLIKDIDSYNDVFIIREGKLINVLVETEQLLTDTIGINSN